MEQKNYDNFCLKCSRPHCAEAEMPRMIIKKLDKYKKQFSLKPNRRLQKHIPDWKRRIKTEVEGFVNDKDYKLRMDIKKPNNIKI